MNLSEINPYILLGVNGFFTGFGIIIGQTIGKIIYKKYIQNTYKKIKTRLKNGRN